MLKIAKNFSLPLQAVTETFAILAKRRVGKTYTASVMAEEMCEANLPFVVLDPTGAWYGLRSSANGKAAGYPVVIIGGRHGDIPLEINGGKLLAEFIVENPGFYVIDLSGTESDAEQDRFATAFAQRLYRLKDKHRDPLHLFIDEADSFIPQSPFPGQKVMLGAFEALVRRGGIRGIGVTIITQRPAIVNKNVLNMTETVIALQTTAPLDQDAADDWIKRNATPEMRKEFMASLASLQQGEAWVYSPGWLEVFQRVNIRQRRTFNSSATPKVGETREEPKQLAKIDLEKLRTQMASTIEKAEAEDPKKLQKKIGELTKQLKAAESKLPVEVAPTIEFKEKLVFSDAQLARAEKIVETINHRIEVLGEIRDDFVNGVTLVRNQVSPAPVDRGTVSVKLSRIPAARSIAAPSSSSVPQSPAVTDDRPLKQGEREILNTIAQYPDGADNDQLAVLTGYKNTSRYEYTRQLIARGYVQKLPGNKFQALSAGVAALGADFKPLPTGTELQDYWLERLGTGEAAVLTIFINAYPESVHKNEVSEKTGYKSTSTYEYTRKLIARRLVESTSSGFAKASDNLFD